jgi:hypothetical protein
MPDTPRRAMLMTQRTLSDYGSGPPGKMNPVQRSGKTGTSRRRLISAMPEFATRHFPRIASRPRA